MQVLKQSIISIISAIITVFVVYGGYTIYAEGNDFRSSGLSFDEAFNAYHSEMNDYFNLKIEKFNKLLKENPNDFYTKKSFLTPKIDTDNDDLAAILKKCGEDNVSTYCVSMGALSIHLNYVSALDSMNTTLPNDGNYTNYEELLTAMSYRDNQIAGEYDESLKVMEATVGVYNEYRLAWPMHLKYQQIITGLVKYKLALKDIRNAVDEFQVRFVDATSSQCE